MDTLIGRSVSHYRVVEKIGAGGMGEVYRARDTRLGRDVALKSLPVEFSFDPERLTRFEREARVLASLSHPNVAGIYGVEESGGQRYLALELVQGETLAARLARGPMSVEETVEVCVQIATGMEAAHELGIVHRDLKPGNVMITLGEQVKVLDFGLAKGGVREPESPESPTLADIQALRHSPVLGSPATMPGVILGTAAYLSPEQARGKVVDRRTDIWSFGCVLYECLTGRRAYEGETVSDVVAGILKGEVDWSRLPKGTPPRLRSLLRRCLEKDARRRLRDMGDARLALEAIREGKGAGEAAPAPRPLSPRSLALAATVVVFGAAVGPALWNSLGPGRGRPTGITGVRRASVQIPPDVDISQVVVVSPDGRVLVAAGRPRPKEGEPAPARRLFRRRMDSFRFEEIEGSEGIGGVSVGQADPAWLYFLRQVSEGSGEKRLVKTLFDGSAAPVTVANWDASWHWQWWVVLGSGEVLAGSLDGTAYIRVPAGGGAPLAPIAFDSLGVKGVVRLMSVLPGDRGVLLNIEYLERGRWLRGVGVLDLRGDRPSVRLLLRTGSGARYSPTGHVLFRRETTLLAVPFDLDALEARGEPVPVLEGLGGLWMLSRDGTLLCDAGDFSGVHQHLIAADGQGRASDWTRDRARHNSAPFASPDGNRVAYTIMNSRGIDEVWIADRGGTAGRRVVAVEEVDCTFRVWSPDGRQIVYDRSGGGPDDGMYIKSLDGGAPARFCRLPDSTLNFTPTSWSPDGRYLLADISGEAARGGMDVVRIAVQPAGGSLPAPVPFVSGPGNQGGARYSPDGRMVAYWTDETDRWEVYVAACRDDGTLGQPLPVGRGGMPVWSRNGRDLFFWRGPDESGRTRVMSVSISREPVLSASRPAPRWDLDSLGAGGAGFDILAGDQLVTIQQDEAAGKWSMRVACIFNFFEELEQRMREAGKK